MNISTQQRLLQALVDAQAAQRPLKEQAKWVDRLMSNISLKPGPRTTLYHARKEIEYQQYNQPGVIRLQIRLWKIAEDSGQHPNTITAHMQSLALAGAWDYSVDTVADPDTGEIVGRKSYVVLNDGYFNPEALGKTPEELEALTRGTQATIAFPTADSPNHENCEIVRITDDLDKQRGSGVEFFQNSQPQTHFDASSQSDPARILLEMAGDSNSHLQMQKSGAKYLSLEGSLTFDQARAHLEGSATYGARIGRKDGLTSALAWDADNTQAWEKLVSGAIKLAGAGARSLLVQSPTKTGHIGGGHLWLVFNRPIDRLAAFAWVELVAPELALIEEAWPKPNNSHGIRLPGGRYTRAGDIDAWIRVALISEERAGAWTTGLAVGDLLLACQNPALLIPPYQPSSSETENLAGSDALILPAATLDDDNRRMQKYGQAVATQWFAFSDEQVIAWFKSRNSLEQMLPLEANGYVLATWRGERTASVKLYEDHWVDFGAKGQRNGKQDGGDSFDLYCRINKISRSEALRRQSREMIAVARSEMNNAAQLGRVPIEWVTQLLTAAGWLKYTELLENCSHKKPQEDADFRTAA